MPETGDPVELYLNRRMQSFTALKSWTGNVVSVRHSHISKSARTFSTSAATLSYSGLPRAHTSLSMPCLPPGRSPCRNRIPA